MDHKNLAIPETGETRIHTAIITRDTPPTCNFTITEQAMTAREAAEAVPKALGHFRYPPRPHWIKAKHWTLVQAAWLAVGIDPIFAARDLMHRGALDALRPLIAVIQEELASLTAPTGTPQDYLAAYRALELPLTAFTREAQAISLPVVEAPAPRQATAPEKRTAQRRATLTRILDALGELDPTLNTEAMPGRMVDFLTLCQAVDKHLFTIQSDAFDKARKGLCRFAPGARETTYYWEKLSAVRAKLG